MKARQQIVHGKSKVASHQLFELDLGGEGYEGEGE